STDYSYYFYCICFFFQAEDGIRDDLVTGVQTCALPISAVDRTDRRARLVVVEADALRALLGDNVEDVVRQRRAHRAVGRLPLDQIGRASCRERVEVSRVGGRTRNANGATVRDRRSRQRR